MSGCRRKRALSIRSYGTSIRPYAKSCLILAACGTFALPDRSLAVHVTAGVLSGKSPQPVATFVSAVRTQRNKDRQFFKETAAVRFSNIRAVTDWASWRYMKCHYVPSPYDKMSAIFGALDGLS